MGGFPTVKIERKQSGVIAAPSDCIAIVRYMSLPANQFSSIQYENCIMITAYDGK